MVKCIFIFFNLSFHFAYNRFIPSFFPLALDLYAFFYHFQFDFFLSFFLSCSSNLNSGDGEKWVVHFLPIFGAAPVGQQLLNGDPVVQDFTVSPLHALLLAKLQDGGVPW